MQCGFSSNDLQAMSIIASTDVVIGDLNILDTFSNILPNNIFLISS